MFDVNTGKHLGAIDAITGEWKKPPVKGRWINRTALDDGNTDFA